MAHKAIHGQLRLPPLAFLPFPSTHPVPCLPAVGFLPSSLLIAEAPPPPGSPPSQRKLDGGPHLNVLAAPSTSTLHHGSLQPAVLLILLSPTPYSTVSSQMEGTRPIYSFEGYLVNPPKTGAALGTGTKTTPDGNYLCGKMLQWKFWARSQTEIPAASQKGRARGPCSQGESMCHMPGLGVGRPDVHIGSAT